MAAPLVQRVELDAQAAQRTLAQLERSLDTLNNPIHVPVDVDVDGINRADSQFQDLNTEIGQTQTELRQLDNQAERTGRELEGLGRRGSTAFAGLAVSAVGFVGAVAAFGGLQVLVRGATAAIQAASNLEESLSKTNVVFESFSGEIQAFAKTAPKPSDSAPRQHWKRPRRSATCS